MLVRPHDAPIDDTEWRDLLAGIEVGELIAPGVGRDLPVVVPTHFALDGDDVVFHLAGPNPVWAALAENPLVLFSVTGPFVYVPAAWNAQPGTPPETGVPTSYYASAQLRATATVTDDHDEIAAILRVQLARMQPEGGHAAVAAGAGPYGKLLPAIRGIRLRVEAVHAKFKFGGNRPAEHRLAVAERLATRDAPGDATSRGHLLRRLAAERRD